MNLHAGFTEDTSKYSTRLKIAGIIILVFSSILIVRLWQLQFIYGRSLSEQALNNRIRYVRLPPSRGKIQDIRGKVLAQNIPTFTFSVLPADLDRNKDYATVYAEMLGMPEERIRQLIDKSKQAPKFVGFPIKKNLSIEEVSKIRTSLLDSKGGILEVKPVRQFPFKDTLCHVIGYLGEISTDELIKGSQFGYRTGDSVGKAGIEKEYETLLRGEEGWERVEIDAKGKRLIGKEGKPAQPGADVTLTIDADFQKYVEDIFFHSAGSVVAIEPDTGRILAMVSKPGFDLNLFSPSINERNWKELSQDPLHPLENRAIRGLYSPASTFKIVSAYAGLFSGAVNPNTRFTCSGEINLSGQIFRCWNPHGHGSIDLHRALVESCDVYFYEAGLKMGADKLAKAAALFGFGMPTSLGLPQELPGLVPTPEWKQRTYADHWKDGETVTLSIGQGYLTSTPLQIALMTAATANEGKMFRPAIVKQITAADGSVLFEHVPMMSGEIPGDPALWSQIKAAMKDVVIDKRGTGRKCKIAGLNIYAKTGTSQVIREKERTKSDDQIPYHERTHAIFVALVNDMPKKIALSVIVEHGGGGGSTAGPLARKILARYYGYPDPGDLE